jgi:hypothetical protein
MAARPLVRCRDLTTRDGQLFDRCISGALGGGQHELGNRGRRSTGDAGMLPLSSASCKSNAAHSLGAEWSPPADVEASSP